MYNFVHFEILIFVHFKFIIYIQQSEWGKAYQLSKYFKVYDWVADDGYNNFDKWIE